MEEEDVRQDDGQEMPDRDPAEQGFRGDADQPPEERKTRHLRTEDNETNVSER